MYFYKYITKRNVSGKAKMTSNLNGGSSEIAACPR
jgi:hypothetical protein